MRGVVIMKLQRTFILTLVCLFTLGLGIVSATEPEKIYPSPVRDGYFNNLITIKILPILKEPAMRALSYLLV